MKVKKKQSSGSIKIDPDVLKDAKEICKKKGVLVSFYATEAVRSKNLKENVNR